MNDYGSRLLPPSKEVVRAACKKCGYTGHLTYQCRNFIKIDPSKDIVLDVSSTTSESEEDYSTPLTDLRKQELLEKLKAAKKEKKLKKNKKRKRKHSSSSSTSSSSSSTSSESSDSESNSSTSSSDRNKKHRRKHKTKSKKRYKSKEKHSVSRKRK